MITIVTDTSVGYSRAEAESRNIRLVSLAYKTSQPAPFAFSRIFEELTQNGGEVLCITLSSALSGTYSSAVKAAEPFGKSVRVINSGTVNGGLHLLVDEAVNMLVGGLTLEEICNNLEGIKSKIGTVFTRTSQKRRQARCEQVGKHNS